MSRNNLNTPEHFNSIYGAGHYDSVGVGRMDRIYKSYAYLFNIWKGQQRVLDVGCGEGAAANWFAEIGLESYGIDFSPTAIANARHGHASGGTCESARKYDKMANFTCADIREGLPYEVDFFDAAVAFEIFEHMENPRALAQEIMRVLKDGGRLFFTCPKPEVSFEDAEHIQAFRKVDYGPLFTPHELVIFNDTDWPRNIWGLVEKREE